MFTVMVEIFSDEQSRGLRYIEAANSGGYQPTATQVTEWVFNPSRRPAQRGRLIEPATPPTFPAAIGSQLADMVAGLGQHKWMDNRALFELGAPARGLGEILANSGGARSFSERFLGTPARYGPGKPAETYIEHMVRMSWIDADDTGGLRLTPLGRALVRHDAFSRQAEDEPSVIVLEADSPLSYVQLVGHIAGCGAAFVIDPYVRAEHLWRLIQDTTTVRVLIGPLQSKNDQDLVELRQILASAHRPIEVRRAADGVLHDRFIIGDSGVMYSVGASWNSVGNHVTTIFQYPAVPADRLIDIAEQWWEEATLVEPAAPFPTQPPTGGGADGAAPGPATVDRTDGVAEAAAPRGDRCPRHRARRGANGGRRR